MPDTRNRRDSEFAKFDTMSTEELQQLLREDASKPMGEESDTDVLFYVMEVLAKRRKERNEGKSPEEALESFKLKYNTENEISSDSESVPVALKRRSIGRWMQGLVATAAILVFVIGGSITAQAMGFDLWELIINWTQETFYFGHATELTESPTPNKENLTSFTGLRDALNNYDISIQLAPNWFPNGYEEIDIRVIDSPIQREFVALYQSGDNTIRVRIANYLDGNPEQIEQSDTFLEVYSTDGIEYYIFNNYDQLRAVWIVENFECYITGPISIDEIKQIIDSIG